MPLFGLRIKAFSAYHIHAHSRIAAQPPAPGRRRNHNRGRTCNGRPRKMRADTMSATARHGRGVGQKACEAGGVRSRVVPPSQSQDISSIRSIGRTASRMMSSGNTISNPFPSKASRTSSSETFFIFGHTILGCNPKNSLSGNCILRRWSMPHSVPTINSFESVCSTYFSIQAVESEASASATTSGV